MSAVYPQDYSGIDLSSSIGADIPVAAPVEEPVIEPVSSEPDHTVEKPHATAIDPDDSNDPGPSD